MSEITIDKHNIQNKIYTIHGIQVMLDRDLAELYQVETRVVNQAVHDKKIDKIFKAIEDKSIKPKQGIFFDGQIFQGNFFAKAKTAFASFDAYEFIANLIKSAKKEIYHIGASLKDLGNKWFAFSKMDGESFEMMGRLK